MIQRPNLEDEFAILKDFQRATVEHVCNRLWRDPEPTKRFLVADETGLGKTMIARGVIAATIDHLWESSTVDRIDIVYVCSNAQIARQNLAKLAIGGHQIDHADRLTLLPQVLADLRGRKVNFVSFTPGTSFNISKSGGRIEERVLLYLMLVAGWGKQHVAGRAWRHFFRGRVDLVRFDRHVQNFDQRRIDPTMANSFVAAISETTTPQGSSLTDELHECVAEFRYLRRDTQIDAALQKRRHRLIGALRQLIARAAVHELEPDLVILDEFQRFKDLLDPDNEDAELAHALFREDTARVLLLSATPYKMYTLPDEPEGDDHYRDLQATMRFLSNTHTADRIQADLRTMRHALLGMTDTDHGVQARDRAQKTLRTMMCRTERSTATGGYDNMVVERQRELPAGTFTAADVRAFRNDDAIARAVDRHDILEYWRSAPYLFNFMENYQVKKSLRAHVDRNDPRLAVAVRGYAGLLDWRTIRRYRQLDPGNAKMRSLVNDVLDHDAWRLAWLPPSLPYYTPGGPYADPALQTFTKRLVFSAWTVVPKAISCVLSYEAERRAVAAAGRTAHYDDTRLSGLLRFQQQATGRLTGMPVLALLYPSPTLARLGDPLRVAHDLGRTPPLTREELHNHVAAALSAALSGLPDPADGAVDRRWYWAAPLLLDRDDDPPLAERFLTAMAGRERYDDQNRPEGLADHWTEARAIDPTSLGRRPADLVDTLARLAVAAPGVCALRAIARQTHTDDHTTIAVRGHAFDIAFELRALFNRPEILAVLRADPEHSDRYWSTVLDHCHDGNLQSVLDEYFHLLSTAERLHTLTPDECAAALARACTVSLNLRSTTNTVDHLDFRARSVRAEQHRMRAHFAARFGSAKNEDSQAVQRDSHVRDAYNSPFWPFVLATTSVGQEGLDFHHYSHAVVHWNLPTNPVDLEQREGRVHRYKGHAIRKNIARHHATAATDPTCTDPWHAMFNAAHRSRSPATNDLTPYWIYAPALDDTRIERYVPAMPLSKETTHYHRLLRTLGVYRLAFGQPRQEDLIRYLTDHNTAHHLPINLQPPQHP